MQHKRVWIALATLIILVLAGGFYALFGANRHIFDGDRAFEHVRALVALGPRLPGTEGSRKGRAYISAALEKAGLEVWEEPFEMRVPGLSGAGAATERSFVNLLARVRGRSERTIAWGTHYDTLELEGIEFLGANDGTSGVGVLIELARLLQARRQELGMSHIFIFLDGEEKIGPLDFNPNVGQPQANACFGARFQASKWEREGALPRAFILLDMVGDADLDILWEAGYSDVRLRGIFERAARKVDLAAYFFTYTRTILDDHVPFQHFGVPSIDLIDFRYGQPNDKGGSFWHSDEDTLDKVSAQSLEVIGEVCLAAVPLLEKAFLR